MRAWTWSRIARFAVAWSCALAIAAVTGEVATRLTGAIDGVSIIPRALLSRTDDPLLPYRLRPGAAVTLQGVPIRVNRFGLRGADIPRDPGDEVRRILVLGDSAVHGWGLVEADTFPVLLEQELRRREVEAEVLNGGVPGYNTESALALLRHTGLSLSPDALVLAVSLNDFDEVPGLSPLGLLLAGEARSDDSWLATHSEFYFLLRWAGPALLKQRWQGRSQAGGEPQRRARVREFLRRQAIASRRRFYAAPSGPGWDRIRHSLRELRDLAARSRMDLAVVILPEEDQLEAPESDLLPQRRWKALCAELELRCLDLRSAFAQTGEHESLFLDLQHPSALGLRVAASATADMLTP